jgi:hypothetical protein
MGWGLQKEGLVINGKTYKDAQFLAGINWPSNMKGCLLLGALATETNGSSITGTVDKQRLFILMESLCESIDELMRHMTDSVYLRNEVPAYCRDGEVSRAFIRRIHDIALDRGLPTFNLSKVPYTDHLEFAIATAKEWIDPKRLSIVDECSAGFISDLASVQAMHPEQVRERMKVDLPAFNAFVCMAAGADRELRMMESMDETMDSPLSRSYNHARQAQQPMKGYHAS